MLDDCLNNLLFESFFSRLGCNKVHKEYRILFFNVKSFFFFFYRWVINSIFEEHMIFPFHVKIAFYPSIPKRGD